MFLGIFQHSELMKIAMYIALFVILILIGIFSSKPMWNDESYTVYYTGKVSYKNLMLGKAKEGLNNPLFYILQKPFGSSRLPSIIFMALAVLFVFYNFCERSIFLGLISLALFMSCKLTWQHMAEVRPYSLLCLLSSVQAYLYLNRKNIKWLALTHVLLAFTSVLSWIQILVVSFLVRKNKEVDYIFLTLVPILIILYYHLMAPSYHFNLTFDKSSPGFNLSTRYFIQFLPTAVIAITELVNRSFICQKFHKIKENI